MRMHIKLDMGEVCPKWYGVSHYDYTSMYAHAYPLGIHFLVRWATSLWYRIKYLPPSKLNYKLMESYNLGYKEGYEDGCETTDSRWAVRSGYIRNVPNP